ncbi:MAG: antibiotic biosynthesis monooxygenase [Sedimentisphaerales bacterium]|nr:antibiotic biosynthesis monooxygenase [Sedimentisphaerales bacterium]
MSKPPLTVIARAKAKEEKVRHVKEVLQDLVGPTRKEPGCVSYVLYQSTDDVCSFVFVETWSDQAALDKHLQTPHLKAFVAQADDLLAKPLDVTLWHEIA